MKYNTNDLENEIDYNYDYIKHEIFEGDDPEPFYFKIRQLNKRIEEVNTYIEYVKTMRPERRIAEVNKDIIDELYAPFIRKLYFDNREIDKQLFYKLIDMLDENKFDEVDNLLYKAIKKTRDLVDLIDERECYYECVKPPVVKLKKLNKQTVKRIAECKKYVKQNMVTKGINKNFPFTIEMI